MKQKAIAESAAAAAAAAANEDEKASAHTDTHTHTQTHTRFLWHYVIDEMSSFWNLLWSYGYLMSLLESHWIRRLAVRTSIGTKLPKTSANSSTPFTHVHIILRGKPRWMLERARIRFSVYCMSYLFSGLRSVLQFMVVLSISLLHTTSWQSHSALDTVWVLLCVCYVCQEEAKRMASAKGREASLKWRYDNAERIFAAGA